MSCSHNSIKESEVILMYHFVLRTLGVAKNMVYSHPISLVTPQTAYHIGSIQIPTIL